VTKHVGLLLLLCFASPAFADWHSGTVTTLAIDYDGSTVAFRLSDFSATGCACSAWSTYLCVNSARNSSKEER
jgi:hypothetical protein